MKYILAALTILATYTHCVAQIIMNPLFARSDSPSIRISKVIIMNDTTYVYCQYHAEEHSWACLSDNTYMENTKDGNKIPILKVIGIPFAPNRKHFLGAEDIQVTLLFPKIIAEIINIIENKNDNESFNIYGIDLTHSFGQSYTMGDYQYYFDTASDYENDNDFEAAIKYKKEQLKAASFLFGTHSIFVGSILYDLNLLHFKKKDYKNAIKYGEEAISIIEQLPNDYLDDIARIESSLMADYVLVHQYDKAVEYGDRSLNKRRKLWGDVPELAVYLDYMARVYYYTLGKTFRAITYEQESSEIFLREYGKQSRSYIQTLTNLSSFYNETANIKKALLTAKEAYDLVSEYRKDSIDRLQFGVFYNYAVALNANEDYEEAINCIHKAKNVLSLLNEEYSRDMVHVLTLEGDIYRHKKDFKLSLASYNKALQINSDDNKQLTNILSKKSILFFENNLLNASIQCDSLAMRILEEAYGNNSIFYAEAAYNYTKGLFLGHLIGDSEIHEDTIAFYLSQSSEIIKRHINESIFEISEGYWKKGYMHIYDDYIPAIAYLLKSDTLNALTYDALLFSKGFLLNKELDYRQSVNGDSILIDLNDSLSYLIATRDAYYSAQTGIQSFIIKELNNAIEHLEQKIIKYMVIKGCVPSTYLTCQDIRNHLSDTDVAIEFGAFNYSTDSIFYYALVLHKDSTTPKLIRLFEEKQIVSDYSHNNISELIWKPLLDSIKGKKNIYFSASGLLNAVGIEYFTPEDIRLCNIYRLSSTKELCKPNKHAQWYRCALFGGLNYDRALSSNVINNTVSERGTFDNLPFSYEEILSIRQELSNCHIDCELYSKDNGTEDIFNKLSNRNVDILHIASHGLFIPSDQASQKSQELNMPFLTREFNKEESNEDNALNRAFVLLSGGNRRITREVCPEDGEDGVLTALEISRLNFKNIDLVVLSACNTAKGDINSEGVFGLQRGFKKAGVNTILMSLDRIDDEATKILMVEFYKNLMSGKTKLQSLKDAQQYLRTTENGKFSDPKYWASFIMLDGLN